MAYGRGTFKAHPNYIAYMERIVSDKCYRSMPNAVDAKGHINWQVSSGKNTSFHKYYQERFDWWIEKANELGVPGVGNSDDRFSITARLIHPTKKRACRLCGKDVYVGYMYINANTAKRLNKMSDSGLFEPKMRVDVAYERLESLIGPEATLREIRSQYPERASYIAHAESGDYYKFFLASQHIKCSKLSPGFMANPPDRLDGFHDYCTFCRKENDPGRSDQNMRKYNHDRRVFEWWAEGDWKLADTLYNLAGEGVCANPNCRKHVSKVSPDHIGPISCGFKQNGFFEPLCASCNSSKNRRFTAENVSQLISYELEHNESVACWQVAPIWDTCKGAIETDADAKVLSNYMRLMQDYYLRMLYAALESKDYYFLTCFLHPEYAYYSIEFDGLDRSNLTYEAVTKKRQRNNGSRSLAARSVRIALEELSEYGATPIERRNIARSFLPEIVAAEESVRRLCSATQKSAIDHEWISVLDSSGSRDSKEAKMQVLIERNDFGTRIDSKQDQLSRFKSIAIECARNLARNCLKECLGSGS